MNKESKGYIAAIGAFVMWGLTPLFFRTIEHINPFEILAHRIIWSFVLLLLFVLIYAKKEVFRIFRDTKLCKTLFLSGFLVSANWWIFIYGVNSGQILATSLGVFINPLLSVLLGAIFLKERLNFGAKIAIFTVFLAILIQIYALGELPLISIFLPLSFALYGLIHKIMKIGSIESIFAETLFMLPFCLIYTFYLHFCGVAKFGFNFDGSMLILSGLVTLLPLLTYNRSLNLLPLHKVGFLQYITPTLSALIAIFVYGEKFDILKFASFGLIWLGILILIFSNLKVKNLEN